MTREPRAAPLAVARNSRAPQGLSQAQGTYIDDVEVGSPVAHAFPLTVRVAFEVSDAVATTARLAEGGAELVAAPIETPWRSLNARLEAPGGMQITVFEELGSDHSAV